MAGGEIATKPDQKTGQVKPLSAVYEVVIPIDNSDLTLLSGQRGFAKIDAGYATLAGGSGPDRQDLPLHTLSHA